MNKLFTKIATAFVGMAMAIGVGVAIGNSGVKEANAVESTVSWTASSGGLGSGIGTGTISTGDYSWDYERTLVSGTSYTGWGNSCIQLGKNGGVENIEFSTSNIPGTIKSVSIDCASYQGKHNVLISVGGTTYLASTAVPTWSNNQTGTKTGTGTSSGEIIISITDGTRALYIKKITVVYEENSGVTCEGIVASLTDSTKVWKKGQTVTASDVTVYAEFSDGTNTTITNGSGVTVTNGTLVAGNNTVTVTYSGQSDSITVFGKAPTSITTMTSSGTSSISLNANGNSSVSDDLSFEVNYNTNPATTDYAATLECESSGWSKTADDGAGNITLSFESNGTFSFTLTSDDDADVVVNLTYVVQGIPIVEYELFSGTFEAGKYIICSGTNALKAVISNNRGAYATVSPTNNKISSPSSDIIWDIQEATIGEKTGYIIHNSAGYLSSTNSDGNATLLATATSKSVWASSGSYEFINQDPKTSTKANLRLNSGYGFACYATGTGTSLTLYKLVEPEKTITSSRMVNGTVSAKTGDSEWTLSGFKFFVTYEGESETEVTSKTTFAVTESIPTIDANDTMSVTVTPTFKGVTYTAKAATVTATLTYVNPYSIERLYDIEIAAGSSYSELVTFDGIYMGESGGGFIVMNGAYGMMVYGSHDVSGYTVGETYLTVTGTLKNYNYLYEINNDSDLSFDVLTDTTRKSNVATPSTYVVDGTESASTLYLANRKTSLSGTVYSIGGVTTAGTTATSGANNTVLVTVGGNNVILYVKSAQATAEVAAKIKVGDPITAEGFTTYFKSNNVATFEVMFNTLVEADASYHAADFAKDLLKATRAICAANDEGNGSALTSVWTTLAGADYWLKIEAAGEDGTFTGGTPDSSIVVPNTDAGIDEMTDADAIAAALYRYDWCTAKYSLTNFMGRTLSVSFSRATFPVAEQNNTAIIVIVVSMISLTAVGGFLFLKKRKEQ